MTTADIIDSLDPRTAALLTVEDIRKIKGAVKNAQEQLKCDGGAECPRCRIVHTIQHNYDNLCDRCCKVLVEDFPDHESVPHIRAAMAAWRVETDEELLARYYDHVDDKYSLAARARKEENVDSGNHDYI